jgi:RND family efflux transporter MFP subunit
MLPVVALALFAGCKRPAPPVAETKPPEVIVATPTVQTVTDYEDFTGRTEAVLSADIRARVSGYVTKVQFKDGTDVPEGAPLFQIDPTVYQAEVDRAKAALAQARAVRDQAAADLDRVTRTLERVQRTSGISREEADQASADKAKNTATLASAAAAINVAEAQLRTAEQNLAWTNITAPFAGRVSKRAYDPGNLVQQDVTVLTSIVKLDPVYVYFDIDDRTLLRVRRLVREGRVPSARERDTPVQVGLPDEDGFSYTGTVDFIDNTLDPGTGTLRIRATVPNTRLILSPKQFVRVRLPIGVPREAVLVPEEALGTDQGQKFVYAVVDAKSEQGEAIQQVAYRPIKPGQQFGRLRVVEEGVTAGERVIVSGLQRVRPGVRVTAKPAPPAPAPPSKPSAAAE